MCVYCKLGLQGKGDRTGKLYWASLVEFVELAGISGRGLAGRDTHSPGTMLGQGRPGQSVIITQNTQPARGLITSSGPDNSLQLESD